MIQYRLATINDNQQLIDLTAESGMIGETGLRIDRKPDFFFLLEMRGETKVFIAVDGITIIGSLCVSAQQVYVGGAILPFHYIGDFKVKEAFRNKGVGLHLCNEAATYLLSIEADLVFLNVSKGNTKPFSFFKNRPHVPDFEPIGNFTIYQFIGKKKSASHPRYKIELATVTDELLSFLNTHYRQFELGAVITNGKLTYSSVYTIQEDNKLVAVMSLLDTMPMKQNVVTKLHWTMTYLLKFMNRSHKLLGISKMPTVHEPVKMLYIQFMAVNPAEKTMVKLLVNQARRIAYEKAYSFVSIGIHERDPLNTTFSSFLKLTFNSVGMLLSINDNRDLINRVKQGVPFEDYSLV